MATERELYLLDCETKVKDFLSKHPHLIRYHYDTPHCWNCSSSQDHLRRKAGVILIVVMKNAEGVEQLFYGHAKCNLKRDKFNRWVGLKMAMDRLEDPDAVLPPSMYKDFDDLIGRAKRYFKQINLGE